MRRFAMQAAMAFKRPEGIDAIVEGYKGEAVDVRRDAIVNNAGNSLDSAIFARYLDVLEGEIIAITQDRRGESGQINFILTPQQINDVLQHCLQLFPLYENDGNALLKTGRFITRLIRNSYEAGHQVFALDTHDVAVDELGSLLHCTPDRRASITIHGDVDTAFWNARYINAHIKGNAGSKTANYGQHLFLHVNKNIGEYSLHGASYVKAYIGGDAKSRLANESKHNRIMVMGNLYAHSWFKLEDVKLYVDGDIIGGILCGDTNNFDVTIAGSANNPNFIGSKDCTFHLLKEKKVIRT